MCKQKLSVHYCKRLNPLITPLCSLGYISRYFRLPLDCCFTTSTIHKNACNNTRVRYSLMIIGMCKSRWSDQSPVALSSTRRLVEKNLASWQRPQSDLSNEKEENHIWRHRQWTTQDRETSPDESLWHVCLETKTVNILSILRTLLQLFTTTLILHYRTKSPNLRKAQVRKIGQENYTLFGHKVIWSYLL